ncbi:uncharacterized protein BX663DRAFT_482642 [Cokeromyces recurvatus]|uniref:uncharacterized protein n=1 Tax=Cokeromyces recurvatus TaxID=90255 RepID=UPI0022201BD8|nr:uncharacterized protein BX663DRAFT_482642 [Cokeromyces recurvatus]KAI7906958.1 hypothetical protein BX663DRAFT_482642 [Cokeromyces recurvatus]
MFRFDSFKKEYNATTNDAIQKESVVHTNGSLLQRITASGLDNAKTNSTSFSIPIPSNSWGMITLTRLQNADDTELDDIVDLLLNQNKTILLLPVSIPSHTSTIVDRSFIMDHVVVYNQDRNQVFTLSGIRGIFQRDQLIPLELLSLENETANSVIDAYNKKTLFDTFDLDPSSIITDDHLKYNILASHVQLPLRDNQFITVMLIQKPILKKDVIDWIASEAKVEKCINEPLTLEDSASPKVNEFIKNYRKTSHRTAEISSNKLLDFLDDLQEEMMQEENDKTVIKQRLDVIETYICSQLYDQLFAHPDTDEAMQDEAIESRIAALNLLDLDLKHLGVSIVYDDNTNSTLTDAIKESGKQLQLLNKIRGAKEKLKVLIKTHEIIAEAIELLASQQAQLKREENAEEVVEVVQQEMKQAILSTTTANDKAITKPTSSVNADILLPILIFTIVKSNPTHLLSNLKFIQRYRRPDELTGRAGYCLTNILAAVSFLETTNLVGLGLSADKVFSHITDLNATTNKSTQASSVTKSMMKSPNQQPSNNSGLKMVSDVFDGLDLEGNKTVSGIMERVRKVSDAAQPILKEGLSELKEITTKSSSPSVNNKLTTKHSSSSSSLSSLPSFIEDRKNRTKQQKSTGIALNEGPIVKFLEMKSVDELKIGEVTELLVDYKRLAAIIKQAGLA